MAVPRNALKRTLRALYDWLDANVGRGKPQISALTPVTTADATDAATAATLANANKAKINAIIAALKA